MDSKAFNTHHSLCNDTIPQYFMLKEKLQQIEQVAKNDHVEKIDFQTKDSLKLSEVLKKKLIQLGYPPEMVIGFDEKEGFRKILIAFQKDHGLKEDGVLGKEVKRFLNIPLAERIAKIKINMERAAKIPAMEVDQVMVNIPTFELLAFEHDSIVFESKIIVGKRKTKTSSINGRIEYIVFNPYWNIPNSIIKKEIIPELKRNPDYLTENEMEWVDGNLRQRPGTKNALGRIKFIFPNPYNMYLHDTPNKNLFNKQNRMFSHGCIRIAKPVEFATYLLGKESTKWTQEDIISKLDKLKEQYIKLNTRVPISVYYMTVFVGENGRLNYRNDVYGLD